MATLDFYIAQADRCRREADEAGLDNVRVQRLGSAAAWDAMAAQLRKSESYLANRAAEVAAGTSPYGPKRVRSAAQKEDVN